MRRWALRPAALRYGEPAPVVTAAAYQIWASDRHRMRKLATRWELTGGVLCRFNGGGVRAGPGSSAASAERNKHGTLTSLPL